MIHIETDSHPLRVCDSLPTIDFKQCEATHNAMQYRLCHVFRVYVHYLFLVSKSDDTVQNKTKQNSFIIAHCAQSNIASCNSDDVIRFTTELTLEQEVFLYKGYYIQYFITLLPGGVIEG